MEYTDEKKFIECLKDTRDYWLNYQENGKQQVLSGVLFSTLVLIDGDSGLNDFHTLTLIDTKMGEEVTCGYLHEFLSPDMAHHSSFVEDLKEIMNYWVNQPDLSIKEALEGMLISFCEYLDGQSELNEYTTYEVIDEEASVEWTTGNLHELYNEVEINKDDFEER